MNISSDYQSLDEMFGIEKLDISTRSFAGVYVDTESKIYCAKEHSAAIHQCKSADQQVEENRMSFMHFIRSGERIVAFIDCLALFGQPIIEEVVQAIIKQLPKVDEVYIYRHPNQIRRVQI